MYFPLFSVFFQRECHELITTVFLLKPNGHNSNTKNCELVQGEGEMWVCVEIQIFQTMFSSEPKLYHQIQTQVGGLILPSTVQAEWL